jgi:hypothetical protein
LLFYGSLGLKVFELQPLIAFKVYDAIFIRMPVRSEWDAPAFLCFNNAFNIIQQGVYGYNQ